MSKRLDPSERDKTSREKRRMIILIALAAVLALLAAGCALYVRWVQKPDLPGGQPEPSPTGDAAEPLDIDAIQPKVGGERKSRDFYTILVAGVDPSSNLTDTIMLASYDVTNQVANVMSIPRDLLINVRWSNKKVNTVYSAHGGGEKGILALDSEVSELVGFMPDYYVFVEWEIVGQMVEAIGGVYYDVPWDMWYKDPDQDLRIDLKAGYQLLDGDKAMQLVRWRKNMDPVTFKITDSVGDVGRLQLQQDFLKAVLKQTLQLKNVAKIGELAELFSQNVVSDLTVENLFWFAQQAIFGGLSVDNVDFFTMPFKYGSAYGQGQYIYPHQSQLLEVINEKLNPFVDEVTLRELDLMSFNPDGTMRSSTGVLADPSAGIPKATDPPEEDEEPVETPPAESDPPEPPPEESGGPPPEESGEPTEPPPGESGTPIESGPPVESAPPAEPSPGESEPPPEESGQSVDAPPAESGGPTDIPPAESGTPIGMTTGEPVPTPENFPPAEQGA